MIKIIKYLLVVCVLSLTDNLYAFNNEEQQEKEAQFAHWGPAENHHGMGCLFRLGFALGGTSPLPIPQEIRSINKFRPEGGLSIGVDGFKLLNRQWGIMTGLRFFIEGMYTEANVKNYKMSIAMDNEVLKGHFTGTDVTETKMTGLTIPFLAIYRVSPRWTFNLGPYISYHTSHSFKGSVYNGYLRENDPTGQKINISSDNPATYDFSEDMRNFFWGLEFGFDCRVRNHLNVFGMVDWGLNGAFQSDFNTIAFTMYPIYATFGLAYYY